MAELVSDHHNDKLCSYSKALGQVNKILFAPFLLTCWQLSHKFNVILLEEKLNRSLESNLTKL